ncbi:hypothetical protein [cyanobacterium endosymbiont of Epithemia turgida]|uniref:hypothetical protein n=1 Tax=cyanobacterium endosymbiont of Epithemia turgida TaxID=718217 RepID=UPI001E2CBF01|nr:hypothetical protein [cyanobacterium endosymbiont of Epithemia turgida]
MFDPKSVRIVLDYVYANCLYANYLIDNRIIQLQNYFFDAGVINNAIDQIVSNWGSFKIFNFNLGI